MNHLIKDCEHCGTQNHSRVVRCSNCDRVIEIRGLHRMSKTITPKFIKNFHLEVDKIRGFKK